MSIQGIENITVKYAKILDEKKQQTSCKIEYISSYVGKWLLVQANRPVITTLTFIDCMCNAGVYSDGEIGTPMKVLELFRDTAFQHKDKHFHLFLNDISADRLEVIKLIAAEILSTPPRNLTVHYNCGDVNDYIGAVSAFKTQCEGFGNATILFVDPYDFRTVKIKPLKAFINAYYCELLWNVFTSDWVRNIQHDKNSKGIVDAIGQAVTSMTTLEQLIGYIRNEMVYGKIRHTFAYEFRNQNNTELYQIMFFTPNIRGLEKLKEALWDTFNGKDFHRNTIEAGSNQMTLFDMAGFSEADMENQDKQFYINKYSGEAKEKIIKRFANIEVEYKTLEVYILENTMLGENHMLSNILKPLIEERRAIKQNKKSKANYKDDTYLIQGGTK